MSERRNGITCFNFYHQREGSKQKQHREVSIPRTYAEALKTRRNRENLNFTVSSSVENRPETTENFFLLQLHKAKSDNLLGCIILKQ